MSISYFGFALLLFLAVVLLLEGIYIGWRSTRSPEAQRLQRRLQNISAGEHSSKDVSIVKQRLLSESELGARLLLKMPRVHQLDRLLQQSGLTWTVGRFVMLTFLLGGLAFWLARFIGFTPFLALGAAVACGSLPLGYVLRVRAKRLVKLEEQLPEALDLIGRAMRAGHAFPTGLQMIGDEMPEPIASEFKIVSDETNFGISMDDALLNLCARVPSTDLRYFVIAVMIQRETGGNLVEILTSISGIIRERLKLFGKVRALSAEGRLSAWILALLPFVLGFLLYLMNPKLMSVLWTDESGYKVVKAACVAMFFGILWMRRLIKIRV